MSQGKTKVYIYTRVSTTMQIDGYSLDAQKARMKAYADFNDYQIVGEYEDAGKSGKSIEGRASFCRMMEDIKSGKDGVSYVLVFKLSRFGRNAADVLSTLQVMQDFGVNLICVEDGIDSSKDAGKLMISVLSAVAEIERENIRVQTMEGRIQKAREGRWNGGFAPYGYRLVDGVLQINEDEAPAIRTIFEQYVNTDTGANGLSKYLETHGFQKLARQNGTSPLFSATLIRAILKNPVYCGKIAFGRRKLEKIHGTRNEYHQVPQENYLLVDGLHEGIVSEELWNAAQVKQIQEEVLDNAVVEVIIKLVSNPKFAAMMQEKINSKVDTTAIEQEITAAEKQLRQYYSVKSKIMEEIDTLDPDDRHYIIRKSDLDERLYKMYDKIEEAENNLMDARAKKQAIEADKITGDNIYKVLVCFEKLYNVMNPLERKKLMEHLISEIQIYPERQPNGQWLKSIKFRLPIVESDIDLCLDNESHTECVIALSKGEIDS